MYEASKFYFDAFDDLKTDRRYDGGPIPFSSILDYARLIDMDEDEFPEFKDIIRRVDEWFLDFVSKRTKRPNKGKGKKRG